MTTNNKQKKVLVIGAGPGGYVAAIKAAQNGFDTTCIESQYVGGTCLNVGCIPSKALLHNSFIYQMDSNPNKVHDFEKMMKSKDEAINANSMGIRHLFKKNKVNLIEGFGYFENDGLYVKDIKGNTQKLEADYIIIATGSVPTPMLGLELDKTPRVLSSTGALKLKQTPKKLAIIGAGVIGLELGSVYGRLGSDVTIFEYADSILPSMEPEVAKSVQKILNESNIKVLLSEEVVKIDEKSDAVVITSKNNKTQNQQSMDFDYVIVAIGRMPNTKNLGLDKIGIKADQKGFIEVGEYYNTSVAGIYAIGDCIYGEMLAHKGYQDAGILIEYISNNIIREKTLVPGIIYTHPEIANVGFTHAQAEKRYGSQEVGFKIGQFMTSPRARISHDTNGFIKVVYALKTGRILGATIVCSCAGEMIHEFCVAIAFGASMKDMSMICRGHPTLNEMISDICSDNPVH